MLIAIYQLRWDVWSFSPEPGVAPIEVRVPAGSALLPVKSIGLMLFSPSLRDPCIRVAWNANQVMREVQVGSARFKLAGNQSRRVAV